MKSLFYRNQHLLILTIVVLLVGGLAAIRGLPRLEDPRINNRNPIVVTAYPGAPAERVEALVTKPLETAIRELGDIKHVETTSRPGVSVVAIELQDRIENNQPVFARIRDKIEEAERLLPPGALKPFFDDERGATTFTVLVALSAEEGVQLSLPVISRLGRELSDRLRDIAGTDLVRLYGEPSEEIRVTLDHVAMEQLGISAVQVAQAVAQADTKLPSGAFRDQAQSFTMELSGDLDSIMRITEVPLRTRADGSMLRVGDVAQVTRNFTDPPPEIAISDGKRSVYVAARVDPRRRVDLWADRAREVIETFQTEHMGLRADLIFDQTSYTGERLSGLVENLLMGALVVTLVIFLLMGWRAALLIASAIPLTACGVLFAFSVLEVPLHQMSIFGMIIALGLLIDNAIVVVDEIRKGMSAGLGPLHALQDAVSHLFVPLLGSTLTTVLSFMPILLLPGNVGDFIGTISVSVILALIFSFVLSMTVLPALAGRFLKVDQQRPRWWRNGLPGNGLSRVFAGFARWCYRWPVAGIALAMLPPILGFLLVPQLRQQFFPPADRDQISLEFWVRGDTAIGRTAEIAAEMEQSLRQTDGVETVHWLVGGSMPSLYYNLVMNKDQTPSYAHAIVKTRDTETVKQVIGALQAKLDAAFPEALTVLSMLGQGPPIESPIQVRLKGPSVQGLRVIGEQVREVLAATPGVLHTRATISSGLPKMLAQIDEAEVHRSGLNLRAVAGQLQANMEGMDGGTVLEGTELLPVRVRFADYQRGEVAALANMSLANGRGESVSLQALADLELVAEASAVTRRDGERTNYIEGYINHDALPMEINRSFLARLEDSGFTLPAGYALEVGGDAEKQADAIANLKLYLPVLLTLMVATLVLSFRSFALAGLLGAVGMLSVGLATLAIWFSGYPFGFNPILGTAGLIGVALNDSIVVLAAIRGNAVARAGQVEAVLREVMGCSRHVLATTLTTIGGFLPLMLFTSGDFWPPLAVVMAGGVAGATFLSVVFIPSAYLLLLRLLPGLKKADVADSGKEMAEVVYS